MVSVNNVSNVEYSKKTNTKTSNTTASDGTSFESYLGESMSMDKIFDAAAQKYDVPVELLKAIGKTESDFDTNAVSSCGAQGVMQLMPATAKELGVTDSFDAEENIMAGSKYIAGLLKKYDGNTKLAVAAYNAGSGNVDKYGGVPPFEETQNYVKKVAKYMNGTDTSGSSATASADNNSSTAAVVAATSTDTNITTKTVYNSSSDTKNVSVQAEPITLTYNNSVDSMDSVFSYNDYMEFLEKYLLENGSKDSDEESNLYAMRQINYNVPVMKLLGGN